MTFRSAHYGCSPSCQVRSAYIRVNKRWQRVGQYHTVCGLFLKSDESNENTGYSKLDLKRELQLQEKQVSRAFTQLFKA